MQQDIVYRYETIETSALKNHHVSLDLTLVFPGWVLDYLNLQYTLWTIMEHLIWCDLLWRCCLHFLSSTHNIWAELPITPQKCIPSLLEIHLFTTFHHKNQLKTKLHCHQRLGRLRGNHIVQHEWKDLEKLWNRCWKTRCYLMLPNAAIILFVNYDVYPSW